VATVGTKNTLAAKMSKPTKYIGLSKNLIERRNIRLLLIIDNILNRANGGAALLDRRRPEPLRRRRGR
jgi:hypothetical protein